MSWRRTTRQCLCPPRRYVQGPRWGRGIGRPQPWLCSVTHLPASAPAGPSVDTARQQQLAVILKFCLVNSNIMLSDDVVILEVFSSCSIYQWYMHLLYDLILSIFSKHLLKQELIVHLCILRFSRISSLLVLVFSQDLVVIRSNVEKLCLCVIMNYI